ncbi:hypothetical protein [Rhizobium grahamii]|uniref:Uncharacterized protein n=1 Tax=Rhizobium grahamii TaxID=1120045 RepID=A0A370KJ34_9HYPH|nr:hypothetical protein [Rhizobium grahamii]RDJ05082.1 hypothetical protein B5K06_26290 [Rhizobium grahamii]
MRLKRIAATLLFTVISLAAVIDPEAKGPEATLLLALAAPLDQHGIDVVLGKARSHKLAGKPRLAALSGYQRGKKDWGDFRKGQWQVAFSKGTVGVLFATKPVPENLATQKEECDANKGEKHICDFVRSWINSKPAERIFLAFTASDFQAADDVRKTLEDQGYTVFVFLKGRNEQPWAGAAVVGEVFATAGHHIVLDTAAARGSAGVAFEASCEDLLVSPPDETEWSKLIAKAQK